MSNPKGSIWRKWDLHVHTPASFHWNDGPNLAKRTSEDQDIVLDQLIEKVVTSDVAVFGIMDYWTFDGYLAIRNRLKVRDLTFPKTIFPGMELRIEAPVDFRLNIQVILSDLLSNQQLNDFKAALRIGTIDRALSNESLIAFAKTLDPSKAKVHGFQETDLEDEGKLLKLGSMTALITRESLRNAIKQIPPDTCLVILPYDTSDGLAKLDWEKHPHDDNYFMQSAHLFETRDPDNVDLFLGRETEKNQKFLGNFLKTMGGKPKPVISGSDAHKIADYGVFPSDRTTWFKADPTFEGLRQTLYEPRSRVAISADMPLEPVLQIKKASLVFQNDTSLSRDDRSDVFCFRGTREIIFSPYLTCIIGGRGTGKSTLLNLMHEKFNEGSNEFFKQNKLLPEENTVSKCVSIEGVSEKSVVEFLKQNEIEQFASDHKRLTSAIFSRLRKLDSQNTLQEKETAVDAAITATQQQLERIKNHHDLSAKLINSVKELATQRGIIESFQNEDYRRINDELGLLNKELQGLKTSKEKFEKLTKELLRVLSEYPDCVPSQTENLNAYEQQIHNTVEAVNKWITDATSHSSLQTAATRELELSGQVKVLRNDLDRFLKARGLSEENLSDVGKASEKIAFLEEEISTLTSKKSAQKKEMDQFTTQRNKIEEYTKAVEELLTPLNSALKSQGAEVKPIELQYRFDQKAFKDSMIQYVAGAIGQIEGRAPRPDYVESKLGKLDFMTLTTRESALAHISSEDGVYAKTLREFFAQEINFGSLKLQAELQLLDVKKIWQIHVLYDDKPVENSSFGQRCTAVIVVLLLLGNTPIVIDEPEAHLDSSLIAKYLVDLVKNRKMHRQIIFATHNANFVINGDAELVHCLSMDDTKVTSIVSTTIEKLEHRELLLALEGGEEAFHQREKRYGID